MYASWKAPTYKDHEFYSLMQRPVFTQKVDENFRYVTPELKPELRSATVKGTRPSTTRHDSVAYEEEKHE